MISSIVWKFRGLLHLNNKLSSKRTYCDFSSSNKNLVTVTKQKHLHLIGINRPEKRNTINNEVAKLLIDIFENFEKDEDAYAAVLYGKGGNFCYGYDLEDVTSENPHKDSNELGFSNPTKKILRKPVVAAINGYATDGGFELAMWCDLRVVEETAVMGFTNRRFGDSIVNGATARLPHLIGLSRALELMLTGRSVCAQEAFEIGLATKITACGTAIGNALSLANSLCKFPQECMRADRWAAYHATFNSPSLEEAFAFEYQNASHVLQAESVSGAGKFVQGVGRHGTFHLDQEIKDIS